MANSSLPNHGPSVANHATAMLMAEPNTRHIKMKMTIRFIFPKLSYLILPLTVHEAMSCVYFPLMGITSEKTSTPAGPIEAISAGLSSAITAALGAEFSDIDLQIRASQNPKFGDYQANFAMNGNEHQWNSSGAR